MCFVEVQKMVGIDEPMKYLIYIIACRPEQIHIHVIGWPSKDGITEVDHPHSVRMSDWNDF
jgi:hypothetical protein